MSGICVVHLVWGPLDTGPLKRFASSYRQHPAGEQHRLAVLFNGVRDQSQRDRLGETLDGIEYESITTPAPYQDLEAYRFAAGELDAEQLLFLNSYSELLCDGWLTALAAQLAAPGVGIVGASGSYESLYSSSRWPFRLRLRRSFPPFPNPHLRTNAFMLERDLMLDLDWPRFRRKLDALRMETGYAGITRQIQQRGLRPLVVGRDRRAYEIENWRESETFRHGQQANLLVSDNRTQQYANADAPTRQWLAQRAWGRV